VIPPVLLDTSAWSRFADPQLGDEQGQEVASAALEGRIWVCLPFLLEAGVSASGAAEHRALIDGLLGLPRVVIDPTAEAAALDGQRELARVAHHRLPPADLILAALADRHRLGVLHYDHHFDQIAEHTSLRFESVWLAPPGAL
jgi:predicted nucleic acid-binding protein